MTTTYARLLLWTPRVLGILVCLFLALLALDAFSDAKPLRQAVPDFVLHVAPAGILLAIVAASWRREWVGGVAFLALAVAYAILVRGRLDWTLVISGPLLVVGVLFLWSWRHHAQLHALR